jgi:ubiquinone/menaquinone biosynthesis C-methylase UbiE
VIPETNYIHGTSVMEQNRLKALNDLTNQAFIDFLQLEGTEDVLELGSGLGLLCAAVAKKLFRGKATGIEISKDQLAKTPQYPANLEFLLGDVQDLPFADASFDLVYGRYILEHVSDPIQTVKEAYRVLRKNGKVVFQENSILWMEFYPACPHFMFAWKKFAQLQTMMGGDAMIGIKLFDRLKKAGFKSLKVSLAPESHAADDPTFKPWIENLMGNLESGRQALVDKNFLSLEEFDAAVQELKDFSEHPYASTYFAWNRIEGYR